MYPEFSSFSVAGDFNENSFLLRIVDAVRWVEKKGRENTYTLFFYSILAMKRKRKIIIAEMNTVKRRNLFYIGEKTSS